MSITRGLMLLLAVGLLFTALLHAIVPHSVATPRRAMETTIRIHDEKAWKDPDSLVDDGLHRSDADGGPHPTRAPSPLETIITTNGLPCEGITGAAVIPSGDGAFWITCRTRSGVARYRVDTRLNHAEPV